VIFSAGFISCRLFLPFLFPAAFRRLVFLPFLFLAAFLCRFYFLPGFG
jgi:hypothetical protein